MTDRELLELAARAAGVQGEWARWYLSYGDEWVEGVNTGECLLWNPLGDDGDALRLAVKIKWVPSRIEFEKLAVQDDPYDATRRAIVRAAAEIGRSMK